MGEEPSRSSSRSASLGRLGAAGLALALAACGWIGSAPTPTERSLLDPSQVRDPNPFVSITAAGVIPTAIHVSPSVPVRFVNNDRVAHKLVSAPELGYGDCPEMGGLDALEPSQDGVVTIARTAVICAFHEERDPFNKAFQGLLVAH